MTIVSLFPVALKIFLTDIEEHGFSLCLVGGAPRDYLLDRSYLSSDLDFEVRNLDSQDLKGYFLANKTSFTELPYGILRIDFEGFDLEFSNPRKEIPVYDKKSHHHFEAVLDKSLSYADAFKRRDFTLNAIGIEINLKNRTESVIDPYQGVRDLQAKQLREVSSDFFLDPVRFLRLIRFMIKYNFEMSASIKDHLTRFDLSELSVHHFTEEMLKSKRPGIFINAFNNLTTLSGLETPSKYHFWKKLKFLPDIESIEDLMVDAFLQQEELGREVAKFFSLPDKRIKDLKSFHESINHVAQATREDFIRLANTPLEKIADLNLLKDLKNLDDKKEWKPYSSDSLLISWDDWSDVKVSTEEIEATPVALRSYLRFHKTLIKVFGNA